MKVRAEPERKHPGRTTNTLHTVKFEETEIFMRQRESNPSNERPLDQTELQKPL